MSKQIKKLLALSCSSILLFSFSACQKESVPTGPLPQASEIETEEPTTEYNPDAIIDRTEFDIASLYQVKPIKFEKAEAMSGPRQAVTDFFDRIYINGDAFDLSSSFVKDGKYQIHTWNNALVLTSSNNDQQYIIAKIGDKGVNSFYNTENNESAKALSSEMKEIQSKYMKLYQIACDDNLEHTGESYYDDSQFGGYYTYEPFVSFIKEHHLEYDIPSYSAAQIKEAMSCIFDIPDNFYYSSSTGTAYKEYGWTGAFKIQDNPLNTGYQYYLMWGKKGIYAVQCYYTKTIGKNDIDYVKALTVAHSDNDTFDRNADIHYDVVSTRNIKSSAIDDPDLLIHPEEQKS